MSDFVTEADESIQSISLEANSIRMGFRINVDYTLEADRRRFTNGGLVSAAFVSFDVYVTRIQNARWLDGQMPEQIRRLGQLTVVTKSISTLFDYSVDKEVFDIEWRYVGKRGETPIAAIVGGDLGFNSPYCVLYLSSIELINGSLEIFATAAISLGFGYLKFREDRPF